MQSAPAAHCAGTEQLIDHLRDGLIVQFAGIGEIREKFARNGAIPAKYGRDEIDLLGRNKSGIAGGEKVGTAFRTKPTADTTVQMGDQPAVLLPGEDCKCFLLLIGKFCHASYS